jgi:hypothetical protein
MGNQPLLATSNQPNFTNTARQGLAGLGVEVPGNMPSPTSQYAPTNSPIGYNPVAQPANTPLQSFLPQKGYDPGYRQDPSIMAGDIPSGPTPSSFGDSMRRWGTQHNFDYASRPEKIKNSPYYTQNAEGVGDGLTFSGNTPIDPNQHIGNTNREQYLNRTSPLNSRRRQRMARREWQRMMRNNEEVSRQRHMQRRPTRPTRDQYMNWSDAGIDPRQVYREDMHRWRNRRPY